MSWIRFFLLTLAAAVVLTACGGSNEDGGGRDREAAGYSASELNNLCLEEAYRNGELCPGVGNLMSSLSLALIHPESKSRRKSCSLLHHWQLGSCTHPHLQVQ